MAKDSAAGRRSTAIRAGLRRAQQAGRLLGVNGRALAEANRAEAIGRALRLVAIVAELRSGGHSYRGMVALLNARGEPTPSGRGAWHVKTLQRLVQRTEQIGAVPSRPADAATDAVPQPAPDPAPAPRAPEPPVARRLRMKAEELRTVAAQMRSPGARAALLRTADTYDVMADSAERVADSRAPVPRPKTG